MVAFIASQQADPARRITYVGADPDGIRAELKGLSPPWHTTAHIERDATGRITAAVIVELDVEAGRAWVLGPWADTGAPALLDAALAGVPPAVTRIELSGPVKNQRLAALAASRGWAATEPSHILVADAAVVAAWPVGDDRTVRAATQADIAVLAPLHDAEFPDTYLTADQMLDGERVALVADGTQPVGYATGEVRDDGEGFIDFVAVDPNARGRGIGRRLVVAITRELMSRSPHGRVALAVHDRRATARALYERLGFSLEESVVAYRSWEGQR